MNEIVSTSSMPEPKSLARVAWERFRRNRLAMGGLVILVLFSIVAVAAPWIAPHDPLALGLERPYLAPGDPDHMLGTDNFGRDVLSRIIWGARTSLVVGVIVVAMSATIGVLLGLLAGFFGGWVDQAIMRLTDLFLAFPFFIFALGVIAVLGPGIQNVMLVLGIVSWPEYARLIRSEVLALRAEPFVESAVAAGAGPFRIILRHLFPNCLTPVVVVATMGMASAILAAAGLSFLGMGVQPPSPEWGAMLNEARPFMRAAPHLILVPGITIMVTVMAINFIGDGLQDALNPKLQSGTTI